MRVCAGLIPPLIKLCKQVGFCCFFFSRSSVGLVWELCRCNTQCVNLLRPLRLAAEMQSVRLRIPIESERTRTLARTSNMFQMLHVRASRRFARLRRGIRCLYTINYTHKNVNRINRALWARACELGVFSPVQQIIVIVARQSDCWNDCVRLMVRRPSLSHSRACARRTSRCA